MYLETERLVLCPLTAKDKEFIFELLNSPGWLEFIGDRGIKTLDDAEKYILNGPVKSYETNGFGLLLVKSKNEETPLGICGLIKRETLEDIDIGFAFLPQFSGQGYAYEAAEATMHYGKNNLKLKRIVAITIENNISSIRLLEKIGLSFEKKIRMPGDDEELMLYSFTN